MPLWHYSHFLIIEKTQKTDPFGGWQERRRKNEKEKQEKEKGKKKGNGKRKNKKRGKGKRKKEEINSDLSCLVQTLLKPREHLFKTHSTRWSLTRE